MISIKHQLNRIKRLFLYTEAMIIRSISPINKKRIFMSSFGFRKYACNPRAITEYLLTNHSDEYEIYWAFEKGFVPKNMDKRIRVVLKYSLDYFIAMYTSKFVIRNSRNNRMDSMFKKKKGQKYIMTWHSSIRLKKIESDAAEQLGKRYVKRAKEDSLMCDLMLSNSKMFTNQLRNSFWYKGDILENCIPRNCIYYDEKRKKESYVNIRKSMGFSQNDKIILYAPTFRNNRNLKYYKINWNKIIPTFEKVLNSKVKVLVRLHPNMSNIEDISSITNFNNVYNITQEPDITNFMFAADIMVSDYTSAMFDFVILGKPCFIYAIDKDEYDRGFYWNLNELPFPLANNIDDLVKNITEFNIDNYNKETIRFRDNIWGLKEDGKACEIFYNWMKNN